jgi:hypothetical protein
MKLNATVEMIPITWPEFECAPSLLRRWHRLRAMSAFYPIGKRLEEVTGFAAVSLQPNAGSQGEYAGLLVIRAYHHSRGDNGRVVCLIPSSAHGTNPASAVMAGMEVVVVRCDDEGNIDVDDLRAKAEKHSRERLAALMITYPSTHGVFEDRGPRHLRDRPRPRRAGLSRRGQHERPGGPLPPRRLGRMCATSICTRPSASPTAAAVPAWARSAWPPIWPRSCPATHVGGGDWAGPPRRSAAPASCPSPGCTSP